ncbi:MAG: OsmC family protein [Acidobacteriota bacterium]
MEFDITFPGGKRVDAQINGWSIATDQAPRSGGEGSAPEPYMLFLASLGTCAGIYVLGFCQSRELPTEGLRITQHLEWEGHKLSRVRFDIHLPEGFPEKYRDAVVRAAEMCAVKRTLEEPPAFETRTLPA